MSISLASFEERAKKATRYFWKTRETAARKQKASGRKDAGERSAVTAGKNMNGFIDLVRAIVEANGLEAGCIHTQKRLVTLPGFFRPTKEWDTLVIHKGHLVASLEFKSQIGPSFGNNFNNRVEESLGNATDLWTAFREGAFRAFQRPFLGYLMFLEDCKKSRTPVAAKCEHTRSCLNSRTPLTLLDTICFVGSSFRNCSTHQLAFFFHREKAVSRVNTRS